MEERRERSRQEADSLVIISSVRGEREAWVVGPVGGGREGLEAGGEGLEAVGEAASRGTVHVIGGGSAEVWEVVRRCEGPCGGGESGIGAFVASLVSHMYRQVGAPHPKAVLASHVVLRLTLAVGIDVAEGAAHGAVSISGLLAGRYAGVIAEGVLAEIVLYVILVLDGDHRLRLRHGADVRWRSLVHSGCVLMVGVRNMDIGRDEVWVGDNG